MTGYRLIQGDSIEVMKAAKAESVHAIVCDPPYAIEFMGKGWDNPRMLGSVGTKEGGAFGAYPPGVKRPYVGDGNPRQFQEWCTAWGEGAMHVLKPGGHILAFGAPRMYHRLTAGLEDAGFEVRDTIAWLYGSGMPKGANVAKMIDKIDNRARKVADRDTRKWRGVNVDAEESGRYTDRFVSVNRVDGGEQPDYSPEAAPWDGWNTNLKPSFEPIVVLRKPMTIPGKRPGTTKKANVVQNVLEHGVGPYNVDGCRVPLLEGEQIHLPQSDPGNREGVVGTDLGITRSTVEDFQRAQRESVERTQRMGRWPANAIIDESVAALMGDDVARYFYCSKASKREREAGLDGPNPHPTVKPLALMRYLVRLVTPPGGVVLDPFMGSGSTGIAARLEGMRFVGIDLEPDYVETARTRLEHWTREEVPA